MFKRKACCSDLLSSLLGLWLRSSVIFFQSAFSSVQLLSRVWLFATPWTVARQASLPSPVPGVYPHSCPLSRWCQPTILCRPLLLLPSIFRSALGLSKYYLRNWGFHYFHKLLIYPILFYMLKQFVLSFMTFKIHG